MRLDRGQHRQQRARGRKDPACERKGEDPLPRQPAVLLRHDDVIAVVVSVSMFVTVGMEASVTPYHRSGPHEVPAERNRGETGKGAEPRIEHLGAERLLEPDDGEADRDHGGRMHRGDRGRDRERLARARARAHHRAGHQRLAMAGQQCVPGTEREREHQREQDEGGPAPGKDAGEAGGLGRGPSDRVG